MAMKGNVLQNNNKTKLMTTVDEHVNAVFINEKNISMFI